MELYHDSDWLHCGSLFVSYVSAKERWIFQRIFNPTVACWIRGICLCLVWGCQWFVVEVFDRCIPGRGLPVYRSPKKKACCHQRIPEIPWSCRMPWILREYGSFGPPVKSNWLPDVSEKTCPGEASMGHRSVYHGCHWCGPFRGSAGAHTWPPFQAWGAGDNNGGQQIIHSTRFSMVGSSPVGIRLYWQH